MSHEALGVHSHSFAIASTIYSFLQSLLPYTLPLFRRIQHHKRSSNAILLATFPPDNTPETGESFAICFFDPARTRGIDAWLFSSLELGTLEDTTGDQQIRSANSNDALAVQHLIALLRHVYQHWQRNHIGQAAESRHGSIIMLGATHAITAAALRNFGGQRSNPDEAIVRDELHGAGGPYRKYIIASSSILRQQIPQLPSGLIFDTVQPPDYDLVVSRNSLIRSPISLESLRSICVREEVTGKLVAWAFLSPDGSIRTLHCEPAWRRNGLGRAVVMKLVEEDVRHSRGGLTQDSQGDIERWQHGDVAGDNIASVKLFESLGGRWAWNAYWMHVDLDRLQDEVGQAGQAQETPKAR